MSGQQYELNTSRFVSAEKPEAGKQLNTASQDQIKWVMLPVEQTTESNVFWENKTLDQQKARRDRNIISSGHINLFCTTSYQVY